MKEIIYANRFKRDLKLLTKRGYDIEKFQKILFLLVAEEPLPERCRPHKLSGNYMGFWECHIEPDWLLVYDVSEHFIELARMGTHSDLFK